MKYYICPLCGELTTSEQINEELSNGGSGNCYCQYMQLQWDPKYQNFEPEYLRYLQEWQEIPGLIYKGLLEESNTVKRLWMLQTVPNAELIATEPINSKIKTIQSTLSEYEEDY